MNKNFIKNLGNINKERELHELLNGDFKIRTDQFNVFNWNENCPNQISNQLNVFNYLKLASEIFQLKNFRSPSTYRLLIKN